MRDRLRRNGLEETNVVHTNGRIFPGSPFCFRQLCVFFPPTSCVYKPWVRGASVLKAPFWSPWTDNDCTASLLPTTQALHAVVEASPKQSLHNRSGFQWSLAPTLPASNCRETDPVHDWQRNSITGRVPRSKLSQFHDAHTGIVQVANHCACRELVPHEI